MKVTRETRDMLVLDHVPWLLGLALLAFLLVFLGIGLQLALAGDWIPALMLGGLGGGMGLLALAVFTERTQLWLDREHGVLLHRRRTILGLTEVSHPLAELDRALIQTGQSDEGRPTRRPALLLRSGATLALTQTYLSGRGPDRAVAAVNRWLTATRGG